MEKSRKIFPQYVELYDGNMDKAWEEFVADVLSGMSTFIITSECIIS